MKKKIYAAITMIMITLLFTGNITAASAATITPISSQKTVISEGYTEDGIHYTIYLSNNKDNFDVTPNIVVSKEITVDIQFDGKIIPPNTWNISYYDEDLRTNMSGTLYLENWYSENFFGWTTYATYSGSVVGRI
ncbi:MAG TPA: hypothetical protein DEG06_02405 [Lachnospiraceae bacterium]|nr:hypothetical protein [Lachnospiraceae bacterium]HCA70702.1 hypothetical protein [Lachnospiraceae bacterium]HCM13938.1 hypothetical protein [Lachnospiraceae bacterium]HCR40436.1 hypothetical protein [Lachnospiraceae bacterium]